MKKAIITGATGMVGATLSEQLLKDGIEVSGIVRPSSKKMGNLPEDPLLNIIECDVDNLASLKNVLTCDYDVFYHFAWNGTYGSSRDDIHLQLQNVKDTLDAVELAHYLGCTVFVGAGSQAEFGAVEGTISDTLPKNPVTGYGIAKLSACKMSRVLCEQYGIRHNWGRIVSTYGPKDNSYTMVMSSIINMLDGKRMKFTKGEQVWDYLYGEDCSRAFYLIGKYGKPGKAYTIGSGKTKYLKDYIKIIRDAINPQLEIGIGELPYYPNQVMKLCADITELSNDTGFVPQVSFEEGIKKTINWYRGNANV